MKEKEKQRKTKREDDSDRNEDDEKAPVAVLGKPEVDSEEEMNPDGVNIANSSDEDTEISNDSFDSDRGAHAGVSRTKDSSSDEGSGDSDDEEMEGESGESSASEETSDEESGYVLLYYIVN